MRLLLSEVFSKLSNPYLFFCLLVTPSLLLPFTSLCSASLSVPGTEQLLGPLIFLSSQAVCVGLGMWRRRRLAPSRWRQVVPRGQRRPVAISRNLIHGWGQGAAVGR